MPDKHTPGPWQWGDGWKELETNPRDPNHEYTGPKYADIGLNGPDKRNPIIPIRVDHYEIEWDSANDLLDLTPANRALIAAAPDLLEACKAMVSCEYGTQKALEAGRLCRNAIKKAEGRI